MAGSSSPYGRLANQMDDHNLGWYQKYQVRRTDGSSAPGGKHESCEYFVLDLTHDPHALAALKAYRRSCAADFPKLADDLATQIRAMELRGVL